MNAVAALLALAMMGDYQFEVGSSSPSAGIFHNLDGSISANNIVVYDLVYVADVDSNPIIEKISDTLKFSTSPTNSFIEIDNSSGSAIFSATFGTNDYYIADSTIVFTNLNVNLANFSPDQGQCTSSAFLYYSFDPSWDGNPVRGEINAEFATVPEPSSILTVAEVIGIIAIYLFLWKKVSAGHRLSRY